MSVNDVAQKLKVREERNFEFEKLSVKFGQYLRTLVFNNFMVFHNYFEDGSDDFFHNCYNYGISNFVFLRLFALDDSQTHHVQTSF